MLLNLILKNLLIKRLHYPLTNHMLSIHSVCTNPVAATFVNFFLSFLFVWELFCLPSCLDNHSIFFYSWSLVLGVILFYIISLYYNNSKNQYAFQRPFQRPFSCFIFNKTTFIFNKTTETKSGIIKLRTVRLLMNNNTHVTSVSRHSDIFKSIK